MNIEIANRLVELRKKNNLSQEALAGKLGISRQAVSKWERAEASPDTDNLILLARLYHISLDELLKTEDEIPVPENEEPVPENEEPAPENEEPVLEFGDAFLEVDPAGQETEWDWDNVQIDENGDYVNGEKNEGVWSLLYSFPMPILIIIVYLIIGFKFGAWHPGWLLFLLIPIWYTLIAAVDKRNIYCFAYPVLATLIYLCLGIFWNLWHPGWIFFLTVPLYYSVASWINSMIRSVGERAGGTDER